MRTETDTGAGAAIAAAGASQADREYDKFQKAVESWAKRVSTSVLRVDGANACEKVNTNFNDSKAVVKSKDKTNDNINSTTDPITNFLKSKDLYKLLLDGRRRHPKATEEALGELRDTATRAYLKMHRCNRHRKAAVSRCSTAPTTTATPLLERWVRSHLKFQASLQEVRVLGREAETRLFPFGGDATDVVDAHCNAIGDFLCEQRTLRRSTDPDR